jgi:hypothetical protein
MLCRMRTSQGSEGTAYATLSRAQASPLYKDDSSRPLISCAAVLLVLLLVALGIVGDDILRALGW